MTLDRNTPPKSTDKILFQLPKFGNLKIDSGLQTIFSAKNNLPIVQVTLVVDAGSKYDIHGKSGLAYLTSQLIDEGAGEYNSLELDDEFESLGTIFGISADSDNIVLSLLTLKENFQRSLELLALVFNSPNFEEDDFRRENKKLLAKIMQQQDDPSFIATTNFDKIIFDGTPYKNSIIGEYDDVSNLTNNDVKNFFNNYFTIKNSRLFVVGNIEENELITNLSKYFPGKKSDFLNTEINFSPKDYKTKIYFIHKADSAQSEIRIGHLTDKRNEDDYFAKVIANSILGGQFSSRLNLNLREDKGYTYGIHSAFMYNEDSGHFEVSTSVNGKDTASALSEILKEINNFSKGIDDKEIEFSKSYLIKRFPAMFESYSQIAHNIATLRKYNLPDNYFDTYIDRISECSKEEIETIAREKIKRDEMVILIVGDREIVLPQLKEKIGIEIEEQNPEEKQR